MRSCEVVNMITVELPKKINLLSQEFYDRVENFDEYLLLINKQTKEDAFKTFMEKMNAAEKSVQEQGFFAEEEVEEELARIWN